MRIYDTIAIREPILKGWSEDKKYYIHTSQGERYLLRISAIEQCESRKKLFNMMKLVEQLGFIMSAPIKQEPWEEHFNHKIDTKIEKYKKCGLQIDGDEKIIDYIENNRYLLKNCPQVFQHGDYHIGNMLIKIDGKHFENKLAIIDFDRFDFGDPWEEFNRIVWCAQSSPHFATGIVNGYFGNQTPPMEFWRLLALYIGSNTLSSVYWAIKFGQAEVDIMINQTKDVLSWYDNMKTPIPCWYLEEGNT